MLEVKGLSVAIGGRELLHDLSFKIEEGETIVLLGKNGAGKSSLASTILGDPKFQITKGKVFFRGQDITREKIDERARRGLFLSFQSPVEIPGLTTKEFLHSVLDRTEKLSAEDFYSRLDQSRKLLGLDPFFPDRNLNSGLSGGEKKKNEILQLLMLRPKLAILDEVDSGLDLDSSKIVSRALKENQAETGCAYLVITHNFRLLKNLPISKVIILEDGRIVKIGTKKLIEKVQKTGFNDLEG